MADAPFGKLKNMIPSLVHKKDGSDADENANEDNSRGQKVSKKQHDVLAQLSIRPQTALDAKILTPSKVKNVGFHTTEEGGYAFKEVEEFHELVTRTVEWYADKLFERDSDVRTLATEVDKYITDFQNMKFEIELLESSAAAANAIDHDEEKIDRLEEKILKLERENSSLRSQNELLKTQLNEAKTVDRKEETQVATGDLSNAEREHLQEMEAWAAEVTVLYDQMEVALEKAHADNELLHNRVEELTTRLAEASGNEEIAAKVEEISQRLTEREEAYAALQEQYSELEKYVAEADEYTKEMEQYSQGLAEALEAMQAEVASADSVPELQEAVQHVPEPEEEPAKPAYRLPPGVSLDDL